ncbi:MAG TPA: hypothetical protein VME23_22595 [Terracidiphilus sp.]|nr:hypothetical protein [Terracidiphilus sp.]
MRRIALALCTTLLAAPLAASAERLIPAGSLIGCTVSEPKINSRTMAIGDPVLCQVGATERYGRSMLPFNSFLEGRFEDYKDPGHFVGKGWMELKFDRMIIEPDTVIPIDARVVDVPGYRVDQYGRILGKGHAVRDTITWMIPILWPIDLINLPRRGPRPTLKEETRLTLKVMDDLTLPDFNPLQQDPSGLYRRPMSENTPPPDASPEPAPAPGEMAYDEPSPAPVEPAPASAPMYAAPVPAPVVVAPPPAYFYGGIGVYGYVGPRGNYYGGRPYAYGPGPYGYGARGYAPMRPGYGYGPRPGYGYGPRPGGALAARGYGYGAGGYRARGGLAVRGR